MLAKSTAAPLLYCLLIFSLPGCQTLLAPYIDRGDRSGHDDRGPDHGEVEHRSVPAREVQPPPAEPESQPDLQVHQAEHRPPPVVENRREPAAVLALLGSADQQRRDGALEGAAAAVERALRINPRSARAYISLAEIRLQQTRFVDAQALAKKGLLYLGERRDPRGRVMQNRLWELVAQAREGSGNHQGAAQARQNIR